jgi:hypothetical protein
MPLPPGRPEAIATPPPQRTRGYSKSQLEPVLRAQGTLERQLGRRKRGRPRIVASWFKQLAAIMADGTPLRIALQHSGITLNESQIRALYRNRAFREMYKEECRKHGRDSYFKRLTRGELFRHTL